MTLSTGTRRAGWTLLAGIAFLWTAAIQGAETKRRTPTSEEILSLKLASDPRISPDGRRVAYRVRETDWKDNEFVYQLWLADVASGRSVPLTRGGKSAGAGEWSPDGRWLAFVTEREAAEPGAPAAGKTEGAKEDAGKPAARQIWLIAPSGGEAWPLTRSETDVDAFHWSRDGRFIAFTAAAEGKVGKGRKEKFGDYEVVERDFEQNQLWIVDVSEAEKKFGPAVARRALSDPGLHVTAFDWSPDSTRIAFGAAPNPLRASGGDEDIYLLEVASGAARKIVALPGPDSSPVFSPDGRRIAFGTALGEPYYYYANGRVAEVEVAAVLARPAMSRADVRDLTAGFDEDVSPLAWTPAGILMSAGQKTATHLFLVPPSGPVRQITSPQTLVVDEASISPDGRTLAYTAEDPAHMAEVYVSRPSPFAPRKLTDMTAQVKDWPLGSAEVVSWKSQDGTEIEGVLRKPADFDPGRRHPLLVVIHGGPTGTSQPTLSPDEYAYPVQRFLARGAIVLEPNYRGSAGYGAAFRALNVRNLGVGDMWDVMSGVDYLVGRGLADPERLGAMGWSQGGYISAFLTTHTDRFRAISVGAGISDWMTYYVSTDITPFTLQYLHATPWDDPEIYAKTSPVATIKQARTPTLIQTGGSDRRVPVPDSYELYRGLRDQGVPCRLQVFTGLGHGIQKPKALRALQESNAEWFEHYVWGDPIPAGSPLYGTSELEPKAP